MLDGKKIIPPPFFNARKQFLRANDGTILGTIWNISLNGTIVAHKGSPNSSGTFWTSSGEPADEVLTADEYFDVLLRKQEALRDLFSSKNDGKLLEIVPENGDAPVKFNPRINGITFDREGRDPMYTRMGYNIELEADRLYIVGNDNEDSDDVQDYQISSAQEDWNIELEDADHQTYRLSHRLSAVGKRYYDITGNLEKPAWEQAQDYVLNKLGLGLNATMMRGSGVLDLNNHNAYNYVRTVNTNELNGEYAVSETWLMYYASGAAPALDDYTVDARVSATNGLNTVTVNGQIKGLENRNNSNWTVVDVTKYDNAATYFNSITSEIYSRATNLSGITNLHPYPANSSVGHNRKAGTINYSYEYNTRGANIFAGALSETYQETYDNPANVFASIPVIGRAVGPILQDSGTTTGRRKRVQITLIFSGYTYGSSLPTKPDTDSLLSTFIPSAGTVALTEDQENWDLLTGRYTRSVGWVYEP